MSHDDYHYYEQLFNIQERPERRPRGRRPAPHHVPKKSRAEILADIVESTSAGSDTPMSYQPARFEEGWLQDAVRDFYTQTLVDDVVARVKGGKEASVYRCAATATTGVRWLAAKVYRPRRFRNLRNDKRYREGRLLLDAEGKTLKASDHRLGRALRGNSDFALDVRHTSWLMHEFTVLRALHAAGADVPYPYAASNNAILMSYVGDERRAAPTLHEIRLPAEEAAPLYRRVVANLERMTEGGKIHGDLSAFNILYWEGQITLIDFPQVIESARNPHARAILARDIQRVHDYFAPYGVVDESSEALTERLWARLPHLDEAAQLADASRWIEEEEDYEDD